MSDQKQDKTEPMPEPQAPEQNPSEATDDRAHGCDGLGFGAIGE